MVAPIDNAHRSSVVAAVTIAMPLRTVILSRDPTPPATLDVLVDANGAVVELRHVEG